MASVRAAFDPAVANDSVLELLEHERDRAPEGIDPDLYRKAVEYSIGRYTRGLPHYVDMVRKIGLTGRGNVIDVGSGAGHWVIALALDNDKVHGVEIREEYVEISRRIASLLGLDNQVTFSVGRGEDAPFSDADFDAACCHGVLMFTDHEAVVRNVGRWLSDGGLCYLGYTTTGSRLHAVEVALNEGNPGKALAQARMLLAQELYRCGLGRTPGNRVRTFSPEELLRLLGAAGFTEVSRPGAQDGPVEFAGYPATVDFVFRKDSAEPEKARVKELPRGSEWIAGLDRLIEIGLPEIAIELIEASGSPPFELELSEVYVRALVKAQRPAAEIRPAADGLDDRLALARGLARHAEWAFEEAYREYAGALEDDPDINFLRADCLLELHQYEEAAALFRADGDGLRGWIGRLTVATEQDDLEAARGLIAEFLESREQAALANSVRARLTASGQPGGADSAEAGPSLDAVWQRLESLEAVPEGVDPETFEAAVRYARERYEIGLPHYAEVVRTIGFTGRDRALDIGSGAGHWCLALAGENGQVEGVEPRREYVAIAETLVSELGLEDRVSFRVGRGEDDLYPPDSFDLVCCHGVLMFTDHELVLRNVARWLRLGGLFYLGYTTTGLRLQTIAEAVAGSDWDRALGRARILMGDFLFRGGVHRTPRTRVRVFSPEGLVRMGRFLGLQLVSRPEVQDDPGAFAGYPNTTDFVFRRAEEEPAPAPDDVEALDQLVGDGLPHAVCEQLEGAAESLQPGALDVLARALVKAGRSDDPRLEEIMGRLAGPEHALARGLYQHDRLKFALALDDYDLLEAHPDKAFLRAACLLGLERYGEARSLFDAEGGLRGWTGALACALESGDHEAALELAALLSRRQLPF